MVGSVRSMVELARESIHRGADTLTKIKYLKRVEALLKEDPEGVVAQFEELRKVLCKLENFRFLVIADLNTLPKPVSAWESFIKGQKFSGTLAPIDSRLDRLSAAGKNPGGVANVVQMPTIDNSHSVHTCLGPSSFHDPNIPALLLAIAYLGATEGPLWNAVRGNGLAYGVNMVQLLNSGQIMFQVFRSPDAYKGFAAVRGVIEDLANGTTPFDTNAFEGAVSRIVVQFADKEPNMSGAGTASFVRQAVYGIPKDFNEELLRRVKAVTVEDVKKVLKDLVLKCFSPKSSNVAVVSSVVKAEVCTPQAC